MNLSSDSLQVIIQLIWGHYKLDLSDYAKSSLQRRFRHICVLNGILNETQLKDFILRHKSKDHLIERISVSTTEMFRDPGLWLYLRTSLLKQLSKKDEIHIWHAGCSSGEEVLSMQILLRETGLWKKATVVASDFNQALLDKTRKGVYSKRHLENSQLNYSKSGGKAKLHEYIQSEDTNYVTFKEELINPVRIEKFDLVLDFADETFDLIFCRNVLIYFNASLQEKVLKKLNDGLNEGGFLILGHNESVLKKSKTNHIESFYPIENIYRLPKRTPK